MSESIAEILDAPAEGSADTFHEGGDVTSSLEPETGMPDNSVAEAVAAAEEAAQTTDEREGELEDANPDGEEAEAEEQEAEESELYRVKVDGQEFEVDLDELKAGYSRGRASTKRFQEAAAMQKSVQGFVAELKKGDPDMIGALFEKIGLDFDVIAEQHLTRKLEELQMPEAQRGMRQLERERAMLQREREEFQRQSQQAQIEREAQVVLQQIEAETERAFRAHGFEPSRALFIQAAHLMEQSLNAGYRMTPDEAVINIKESLMSLPRDALARVVGNDKAAQMRKEAGQQAASKARKRAAKSAQSQQDNRRSLEEVPYVSTDSFDDVRRLFDM